MSMQPAYPGGPAEPYLVSIGNIHATAHHVVTPAGTWSIADVNVATIDQTQTYTKTATWAIVLAIVLVWFFLLSLLFLLVRETRIQGYIAVSVTTRWGHSYVEQVPVINGQGRADVFGRATYLQSLIGQERARLGR